MAGGPRYDKDAVEYFAAAFARPDAPPQVKYQLNELLASGAPRNIAITCVASMLLGNVICMVCEKHVRIDDQVKLAFKRGPEPDNLRTFMLHKACPTPSDPEFEAFAFPGKN